MAGPFLWEPAMLTSPRCSPALRRLSIEEISPCKSRAELPEMKLPGQNRTWHLFAAIGTIDDVNLSLQNRVALVAGSSRGIGKAIAAAFLREGCRVCITGRSEAPLSKALAEFEAEFGKECAISFCGDLTDSTMIEQALRKTHGLWRRLDVVVANLGSGSGKTGWQLESEEWERLFRLNFWGSVNLAQSAIPLLAENQHGAFCSSPPSPEWKQLRRLFPTVQPKPRSSTIQRISRAKSPS